MALLSQYSYNSLPVGSILQTSQFAESGYRSITSVVDRDDTAPTITSGVQLLSGSITPSSTSNEILVRFNAWGVHSTVLNSVAIVCRDLTVIQTFGVYSSTNERVCYATEILDNPATINPVIYSVRIGSSAGTVYINGSTTTREYGGTSKAVLTLQEIKG